MFSSEKAPEWKDSDCCSRCRVQFGMMQRKVRKTCSCFTVTIRSAIYGPQRKKTYLWRFSNNKGADHPGHPCSLISTFVIPFLESSTSKLAIVKSKLSMIRKYHNHTLQTNPGHREEELQSIYSNNLQKIGKTIKAKQPTLSSSSRWLQKLCRSGPD